MFANILKRAGLKMINIAGDGNCLFNAISMALFGHERFATEIRVKTCIELVQNRSIYESENGRLSLVSPSLDDACRDASTNFSFYRLKIPVPSLDE